MRTTLNIDSDVLIAAKELARRERKTVGKLVSDLMREALRARAGSAGGTRARRELYGFKPIPAGGSVVATELVDELRETLNLVTVRTGHTTSWSRDEIYGSGGR